MSDPAIVAVRMPKWGMAMDESRVAGRHPPLGAVIVAFIDETEWNTG